MPGSGQVMSMKYLKDAPQITSKTKHQQGWKKNPVLRVQLAIAITAAKGKRYLVSLFVGKEREREREQEQIVKSHVPYFY